MHVTTYSTASHYGRKTGTVDGITAKRTSILSITFEGEYVATFNLEADKSRHLLVYVYNGI